MTTIHKYRLPVETNTEVRMPQGAKVVHIGAQGNQLYIWAEVVPVHPMQTYRFEIYGTGQGIQTIAQHLGTVQLGEFVWHVYGEGR